MQNPKLRYALEKADKELPFHEQERLAKDILYEVASYASDRQNVYATPTLTAGRSTTGR